MPILPEFTPTRYKDMKTQSVPKTVVENFKSNVQTLKDVRTPFNKEGKRPAEVLAQTTMNNVDTLASIGMRHLDVCRVTGTKAAEYVSYGLATLGNLLNLPLKGLDKLRKLTPSTIGMDKEAFKGLDNKATAKLITETNKAMEGKKATIDDDLVPLAKDLAKRRKKEILGEKLGFTPKEAQNMSLEELTQEELDERRVIAKSLKMSPRKVNKMSQEDVDYLEKKAKVAKRQGVKARKAKNLTVKEIRKKGRKQRVGRAITIFLAGAAVA